METTTWCLVISEAGVIDQILFYPNQDQAIAAFHTWWFTKHGLRPGEIEQHLENVQDKEEAILIEATCGDQFAMASWRGHEQCAVCGDDELEGGSFDTDTYDDQTASQECTCVRCGARFTNVYAFIGSANVQRKGNENGL